jgi:anti-anti-sigma factor
MHGSIAKPALTWSLRLDHTVMGGVHVFAAVGRLGTLSSGELVEALLGAIHDGARGIVIDLAGVDYVSSAGLLAFDAVSGRIHQAGGSLVLCGLVEPVRVVFSLAALLTQFAVEPTRELAVARVAGPAAPPAHDRP